MKMTNFLAAILCVLLAVPVLPGCTAGDKARDAAVQTIDLADDNVEADIRAGVDSPELAAVADEFFYAVGTKDRDQIAGVVHLWPMLRDAAELGFARRVAAGEIGPGVVVSKRVRLNEFERVLFLVGQ